MSSNIILFYNTKNCSCKEHYLKKTRTLKGLYLIYIYIQHENTLYTEF
jgi:hypothetical protein